MGVAKVPHTAPTSAAEYERMYNANMAIGGYGLDVHTSYPCPFCCYPGHRVIRTLETEQKIAEDSGPCPHCGRSYKALIGRRGGSIAFEMVQTGGDDPPEWLVPRMRRVEELG